MAKVLGLEISSQKAEDIYGLCLNYLKDKKKIQISKVNTEFLSRALSNQEFLNALKSSNLNIADGRGVLWAARYLSLPITKVVYLRPLQALWQLFYSGAAIIFNPNYIANPIPENVPGVDALKLMLRAAVATESGVFFFGATQNDLDGSISNIKKEMPTIRISGSLNGYDFQNGSNINPVDIINKTDAKLLIVALGSPQQEYWIRDNLSKLKNVRVAVGEGGSLSFLAGTMKRAPKWMQKIGLEWLWRLFANPSMTHQTGSRIKRVWNAVPVFAYNVYKYKLGDHE